jgi:hypothetical protein
MAEHGKPQDLRAARQAFAQAHGAFIDAVAKRAGVNAYNLLHAADREARLDELSAKLEALRAAAQAFGPPAKPSPQPPSRLHMHTVTPIRGEKE